MAIIELNEFLGLAAQYDKIPVARTLLSDGLTPVLALRKLGDCRYACLFESVVGGEKVGRYSFLGVDPHTVIRVFGNRIDVESHEGTESFESAQPLEFLRQQVTKHSVAPRPDLPPLTGGAIGYFGYDVVRYFERLPSTPADDRHLPDLAFGLFDQLVVFDHVYKTLSLIVLATPTAHASKEAAYDAAQKQLDALETRLLDRQAELTPRRAEFAAAPELPFVSNFTQSQFESAVRKCVEYIEAGDIFQVVISQRFQAEVTCDPLELYRTLRVLNPSPFMFYLKLPEVTLIGSSPEIMCRVVDQEVTVRPLAGTRPRGKTPAQDLELEQELRSDPKECAEHVMLVDLGRNDVGRVAQVGSIKLPDIMIVERYSHVMHLSSTVVGRLRADCDSFDALGATLPAGTVSGAPKIRAMEIIDSLEPHKRGPYAGAVGYLDYRGNMDTCITLRTVVLQNGKAYVQAGAGIVADSNPTAEYQETVNKARGLMRAISITEANTSLASHS
ncbi:MAG: anthranilate synthase component I [Planctomycetaceae bacterium]|nr:anthranilate synthase component I [Planctomycetaceae bacterium]